MWIGEPGKFVEALVKSGYLDTTEEGDIVIHDWYDYAGKLIEKRKEDAERKRQSKHKIKKSEPDAELQSNPNGVPTDIQRSSEGVPSDVHRNSNVTVQYSNSTNNKRDMGRFTPPTPDDVKAYCAERHNSVNPERFIDFYASKGWMIGKNRMKDWKAAVRSWEKNEVRGSPPPVPTQKTNFDQRQYDAEYLNSFEIDLGGAENEQPR